MNDQIVKMTFGDKCIVAKACLIATDKSDENIAKFGFDKWLIGGTVVTKDKLEGIDHAFSMIDCDIIIIPKIVHKDSHLQNRNFESILADEFYLPNTWATHINIK
jgi:hypothetical protein